MRHNKSVNHLGRTSSHRKALLSNMASSLILNKRITTTVAKAKALQKIAESYIKNNRCDADDGERLPWEEIKPKDWSFSVDPAVAGVKVDPKLRERAAALKKKYLQEADAEEVEATVVPEDQA